MKMRASRTTRTPTNAQDTTELTSLANPFISAYPEHTHMAVNRVIAIAVVDTYVEPLSGLMVGWVTPAGIGNIARC